MTLFQCVCVCVCVCVVPYLRIILTAEICGSCQKCDAPAPFFKLSPFGMRSVYKKPKDNFHHSCDQTASSRN